MSFHLWGQLELLMADLVKVIIMNFLHFLQLTILNEATNFNKQYMPNEEKLPTVDCDDPRNFIMFTSLQFPIKSYKPIV